MRARADGVLPHPMVSVLRASPAIHDSPQANLSRACGLLRRESDWPGLIGPTPIAPYSSASLSVIPSVRPREPRLAGIVEETRRHDLGLWQCMLANSSYWRGDP